MLDVKVVCMFAFTKSGMCVGLSLHYLKIQAITVSWEQAWLGQTAKQAHVQGSALGH
jgi:hypothetical protein